MKLSIGVILIVAGTLTGLSPQATSAQPWPAGYVEPSKRNAALMYWQAWSLLAPEVRTTIADIDWKQLGKVTSFDQLPKNFPSVGSDTYSKSAACLDSLVAATAMSYCNFEVAHDQGAFALMPHLGHYRAGCRALRYHARLAWMGDQPDRAAEYLAAAIRSANHISRDGVVISSLVAVAGVTGALEESVVLADSGKLTSVGREKILQAIQTLPSADPAGLAAGLANERDTFLSWIPRHYTGPDAGKKLATELLQLSEPSEEQKQIRQRIETLDGSGIQAASQKARVGYDALIQAYSNSDPKTAIAAVETRIKAGEFGELFTQLAPSVQKIRENDTKFRNAIDATLKALQSAKVTSTPATAPDNGK